METPERLDRQSGRAPRSFLRFIEEHGIALRHRAGLGPQGRLDPFATATEFGIVVANPESLQQIGPDDIQRLKEVDARTWSGGAKELPDGRLLVLLNSNQTSERAVVTVMEEVAHAYFGHRPSSLTLEPTGLFGRVYDKAA